jgi:tRNA dimethylallyltransferase
VETVKGTPPLLVIVGQTGSGKSALALELAQKFNGEIICADSRTVYQGLDIGTAKPTAADQAKVRHHLLDVITPDKTYSAALFKQQAQAAIDDIVGRGKLPMLVGGSGLYVDSVIYNFDFNRVVDLELRNKLQGLTVDQLQQKLESAGIALPDNSRNPRHLVRALEAKGEHATKHELRPDSLILEPEVDALTLKKRLEDRVNAMVRQGLVEEATAMEARYGADAPGLRATGYRAFHGYLNNEHTLEQAKQEFIRNDWQLARRQRTWFKRNKAIRHICNLDEAVDLVTTWLNKYGIALER